MAFQPVDRVPDLPCARGRHVRALTRLGHHHHHHVLGVARRRERGEHRGGLAARHLGGAGLGRDLQLAQREPGERARRRALGDDVDQRALDVAQRPARRRQVAGHRRLDPGDHLAGRGEQRRADPRAVQGAAVGERGVGPRELQRGDGHVALADRGVHRLAGRPYVPALAVVVLDLLDVAAVLLAVLAPVVLVLRPVVVEPLPGGHGARRLLRQVDPGVAAEPPGQLHLLHLLDRGLRVGPQVGAGGCRAATSGRRSGRRPCRRT